MGLVRDKHFLGLGWYHLHPAHGFISSTAHSRPTIFLLLSDTRPVSTKSHAEFMYHHENKMLSAFHLHTSTFKGLVHNNYLYFMTFLRQAAASRCEGFPTFRELTPSLSSHLDAAVCPRNFLWTLMSLFCSAGRHLENQCCQTKLTAMLPTREQMVLHKRQKYS
jgi:hypothetical protein